MEPVSLLQQFVSAYGPPGEEEQIRAVLTEVLGELGVQPEVDAKGNVVVRIGDGDPDLVVTAHMDEIAMIVRKVEFDGTLLVDQLGGMHPWKIGEGPVDILADTEPIPGILGFGSMHTEDPSSNAVKSREKGVDWSMARVFTSMTAQELMDECGVRAGTRVVVSKARRKLTQLGNHVAGHFLDNRACLVTWILTIQALQGSGVNAVFAATASEEVGGEGVLWLLEWIRPSVCLSLELGPNVPDAPVDINSVPTVWSKDSYAAMSAADLKLVAAAGRELRLDLQFQTFSRGGSDATIAASHGVCARPITLGLPIENSHGYEIMHRDAMEALSRLTANLLRRLTR